MKKISIIIPLYNIKPDFLDECLKSCIEQEYNNYEIILIDDGSTIDYSSILSKYSTKIIYLKTSNQGVSYARNVGIKKSSGEYLLFLDSDDYLPLDSLNTFSRYVSNHDYDIILSKAFIVGNDIKINKCSRYDSFEIEDKEKLHKALMFNNDSNFSCIDTVWAKLYKKDFLNSNCLLFNEKLKNCEDVIFNYEAYHKAQSIYFLNIPTYYYRVNASSACHTFQRDMQDISLTFLSEFDMLMKKLNIDDCYFSQYVLRIIVRLFRKYYRFVVDDIVVTQQLLCLLNNSIILDNIDKLNKQELEIYKIILIDLIKSKDIADLKLYINDVCKHDLLKK